ncbi:MAG TPA: cyclic nucleotide-binding domain-containing protein, partial [Acidisarcina sp.]
MNVAAHPPSPYQTEVEDYTPAVRTPLPEIVEALKRLSPLQGLTDKEFEWLGMHCTERKAPAGAVLFRDGAPADSMTILVKGEIHVRRGQGGAIFIGRSGQITGKLPFSRMKTYGGQGFSTAPVW